MQVTESGSKVVKLINKVV